MSRIVKIKIGIHIKERGHMSCYIQRIFTEKRVTWKFFGTLAFPGRCDVTAPCGFPLTFLTTFS